MCVLAMIGIATQAQDNVLYEISSTPATEVVEGHIYVLQNRAYPEEVLTYSNNIALTTGWESIPFGYCLDYQSYFIAAGADGFTLPITLDNINDNGDLGYGNTGGGTVLSPTRAAADNTVYFTVKDAADQYVLLDENHGLLGANATKIAENAQWIAYEAKEHTQHVWECREDYVGHVCSLCDQEESHNVPNEDGKCTVCDYTCPEHDYFVNDRASILATMERGESIMVYECNNCHYQKTMHVETGGECEGNESGHEWYEENYDPTCAMPGYTVHRCYNCDLEYYTDFTDTDPDNHFWIAESDGHFCNYGCAEHGASWAEHTMVEGKCTVCGYWPGHTEHQWLTDSNGHHCTIPGCEYSGYEDHTMEEGSCACTVCGHIKHQYENGVCQNCRTECQHEWDNGYCNICGASCEHVTKEGSCLCTICGNTEHYWDDGVCENCGAVCDHENPWYEEARDATCINDGNKGYYGCVCDLRFADADCTEKITLEDILIPATGHQFDEEHHCTVCYRSIIIGSTITLGEAANVDFINYCGRYNEKDPTAEPLYKIELTKAAYNFSISEELESPSIAIFDKDFNYILTVNVNEQNSLEAGTYYLLPSAYSEDEDEGGYVEFACTNVPLTITLVESLTININDTPVGLTFSGDGYVTAETINVKDGNEFSTPVEFTASSDKVTVERTFTADKPASVMLPFTVAASQISGATFYEFGGVSFNVTTQKWEATMNAVTTGDLEAYKPYMVVPAAASITFGTSEQSATFPATSTSASNMEQSVTGWTFEAVNTTKTWSAGDADLGRAYGFAAAGYESEGFTEGQFVKVGAGASAAPGRCYLLKDNADPLTRAGEELPATIGIRFVVGSTTGIGTLDTETGAFTFDGWYDLQGNRVSDPMQGGVMIKNNKKVMVK